MEVTQRAGRGVDLLPALSITHEAISDNMNIATIIIIAVAAGFIGLSTYRKWREHHGRKED
nr:MAG TPA: transmembrane protein [Caudoviricetes sp.]